MLSEILEKRQGALFRSLEFVSLRVMLSRMFRTCWDSQFYSFLKSVSRLNYLLEDMSILSWNLMPLWKMVMGSSKQSIKFSV